MGFKEEKDLGRKMIGAFTIVPAIGSGSAVPRGRRWRTCSPSPCPTSPRRCRPNTRDLGGRRHPPDVSPLAGQSRSAARDPRLARRGSRALQVGRAEPGPGSLGQRASHLRRSHAQNARMRALRSPSTGARPPRAAEHLKRVGLIFLSVKILAEDYVFPG
jgi:hypothetical protein